MIAAQFIFEPGTYDDEFHELDASIDNEARSITGFLGTDRWFSEDGLTTNAIYYFTDMAALTTLGRFNDHRTAKLEVGRWYKGFRVIVTEVTATYGNMPHIAAGDD